MSDEKPSSPLILTKSVDGHEITKLAAEAVQHKLEEVVGASKNQGPAFCVVVWGPDGRVAWATNRTDGDLMNAVSVMLQELVAKHRGDSRIVMPANMQRQ